MNFWFEGAFILIFFKFKFVCFLILSRFFLISFFMKIVKEVVLLLESLLVLNRLLSPNVGLESALIYVFFFLMKRSHLPFHLLLFCLVEQCVEYIASSCFYFIVCLCVHYIRFLLMMINHWFMCQLFIAHLNLVMGFTLVFSFFV